MAVIVVPGTAGFEAPRTCQSSQARACTLRGLSPGDYSMYAVSSLDDFEYAEPEALRRLRPVAKVSVQAGSTQIVSIEGTSL